MQTVCSNAACRASLDGKGRYCRRCHAAKARESRRRHPQTAEQRAKDIVRSIAGVYRRRGKLIPRPCACGSTKVEMHHPDYGRPLEVEWICDPCHHAFHVKHRVEDCGDDGLQQKPQNGITS